MHNATHAIIQLLQSFTGRVQKAIKGEQTYKEWQLIWKEHQQNFCQELGMQKPVLFLRGCLDKGLHYGVNNAYSIEETLTKKSH